MSENTEKQFDQAQGNVFKILSFVQLTVESPKIFS